jgi:cation transport regulator
MPYSSNSQLPAAARKRLTPHQQDVFRATFNNALKEYRGNESKAYAAAWSAAKKA